MRGKVGRLQPATYRWILCLGTVALTSCGDLSERRNLGELSVPALDSVRVMLETAWIDGRVYYDLQIRGIPYTEEEFGDSLNPIEKAIHANADDGARRLEKFASRVRDQPAASLRVELRAGNGFALLEDRIYLGNLIKVVDDQSVLRAFEFQRDLPMSESEYRQIDSWRPRWTSNEND